MSKKVRLFSSTDRLVLWMLTKVHEQFSRSLSELFIEQLCLVSHGSVSAAEFANDIRDFGPATIRALLYITSDLRD